MKRSIGVLCALALFTHPAALGAQGTLGTLAPELKLDGAPAASACTFVARSTTGTFESATGGAIELPAGDYALRVECKTSAGLLVPAAPPVKITAGKPTAPKLDVRTARLRVEARRNGTMLPAKVHLFPAGALSKPSDAEDKPLASLAANQRAAVAAGRYDVLVQLDDPRSPRAEVLLASANVAASGVVSLEADLSDGGLVASATMNGKRAAATVRAFVPGTLKDLGMIDAGEELRLPAGRYTITTELRETADFTTKRRDVWIRAGQLVRFTEAFESGLVSASVVRDGKPVDATVLLARAGAPDSFNHFAAPGTVTLSPGRYDITITSPSLGPLTPPRQSVDVGRGKHARLVFDLTPATLTVRVVKANKPIDAEVHVRAAGGGADAGPPDVTGAWRLWPGRYELVAIVDGAEVLDGPFEVKLGEKLARTVTVVRAQLTVIAKRGKSTAADAEVFVFRPGATKPIARGRAGANLEVTPGVYDVKVVAGADQAWREGVRVKAQQTLHVELGAAVAAGADEPLPDGELPPPGDELPDGEAPTPDAGAPATTDAGVAKP
ncbi:hypothetical protein L6R52_08180 [Myxococcota bacterium]|nr:hypothetical protein [Myxococcota bacterium]